MIRINWAVICFFIAVVAKAQTAFDWFPARPAVQYNYKTDTSASPISNIIKIDSALSQTYYLNKIVTSCDTCHNAQLVNDPFDSTYCLNHQPQFLDHAFIKAGQGFWFKGNGSFVLYPHSAAGATWLYDTLHNISATMLSKSLQTVLGSVDSVCTIKLSSGDTIVLSKSRGVVKFPVQGSAHHSYVLVGLEGAVTAGVQLKRFHDFFDLQTGDVLQYEFIDNDYNLFPPMFMAGRERWDILSATVYNDSVRCTVRKTHLDSLKYGGGAATLTVFTSTMQVTFLDSVTHPANALPLQQINVNSYFMINNGIRHIHKLVQGFSGQRVTKAFGQVCPNLYLSAGVTGAASETPFAHVFLNRNSAKIVGRELTEGLGFTSELYNDYDRIYQKCLVGYVKNGDTSGVIYHDDVVLGIKQMAMPDHFSVYPVPANEQVIISGSFDSETRMAIVNAVGETVFSGPLTRAANTAFLSNGLYFIVISNRYFSETKKLVIQH